MSKSLFGALVTWQEAGSTGFNGLQRANQDFLKAIIRYSLFNELHFFLIPEQAETFKKDWKSYLNEYGAGKVIKILPVFELPEYFEQYPYSVFHSGDPYISNLALLREHHAPRLFPITGRAHTLSDDPSLLRIKELLFSPVKSCDAILCSSSAQQKVMERLLSSASATFKDSIGVAVRYSGQVEMLPLGVETVKSSGSSPLTKAMKQEVRKNLGINNQGPMILCLGRLSPSDKMDLQPLLLVLNDLLEEGRVNDLQLVIAGSGDAGSEYVRQLMSQAYDLNLEDHIRFELAVDEERKEWLLAAADVFVSLADNVQESFGLAPVEAMLQSVPVVLSSWNGYRELLEDRVSGYLIPTLSGDVDPISRSISLLHKQHASFVQAQSTSFDCNVLASVLELLLNDETIREKVGREGKIRTESLLSWPVLMDQYHQQVEKLSKEVTRFRHRQGRAVGMPYHHVFGHYPSSEITGELLLQTSGRGLRVLLQSEKTTAYRELEYLQSKSITKKILTAALQGSTVAEMINQIDDQGHVLFVIARLMKYQLLVTAESRVHSWKVPPLRLNNKAIKDFDKLNLNYPEQQRSHYIKPFVAQFLRLLDTEGTGNSEWLQSVGQFAIEWLDSRLMQAIGWFAESRSITNYGEVLLVLEESGGLNHLRQSFPLWRKNCRREFFRHIKRYRQIQQRFNDDLADINGLFFNKAKQAGCLTGIKSLNAEDKHPVYALFLDNGEKLVYKTRDLSCDQAVSDHDKSLMKTVNEWLSGYTSLGVYKVLPRTDSRKTTYGYAEFIASEPIDDAENYYRSLGVLSGFSLLTGLSDINHQNVIVRGSRPYIVDSEMLFHGPALGQLEREIDNPQTRFLRGLDDSSFSKTGLRHVWETFHTYKTSFCSVTLKKGEVITVPPQSAEWVSHHVVASGGQSLSEALNSGISREYIEVFLEGFEKVFTVITEHRKEWQALLERLQGIEVRYSPLLNINETQKLFRDQFTAEPLQKVSSADVEKYFSRMATRVTQAGQVSQRWLATEGLEPVGMLAESYSRSWLNLEQSLFVCEVGGRQVFSRNYDGLREGVCDIDYFECSYLQKALSIAEDLESDKSRLAQFLQAYREVLSTWLGSCQPGADLPDTLRSVK